VTGFCEPSDELPDSIKGKEFVDQVSINFSRIPHGITHG
jgi:hypothetical protein